MKRFTVLDKTPIRNRSSKVGRRAAVFSGFPDDPLDALLTAMGSHTNKLAIPTRTKLQSSRGGEYDFLSRQSTSARKRVAGSMIISRKDGISLDALQHSMQDRLPREISDLKTDEFGEWFYKQVIAGLDFRKEIRDAGGRKKYLARVEAKEAEYWLDRQIQEASDFLREASDQEYDDFTSKVFQNRLNIEQAEFSGGKSYLAENILDQESVAFKNFEEDALSRIEFDSITTSRIRGSAGEALVSKGDSTLKVGGKVRPAMIVDLDDTLFTPTKVAKRIEDEIMKEKALGSVSSERWAPWNRATQRSRPIPEMIDFVKTMQEAGIQPVVVTARDEALRPFTTKLLKKHGINSDFLFMKGISQEQQDLAPHIYKAGVIDSLQDKFNFLAFLDDSKSNLMTGYKANIPLGIQPNKTGYDGLQASISRGLSIASDIGPEAKLAAVDTLEGLVKMVKPLSGKTSNKTLQSIFDAGLTALNIAKGRV